MSDHDIQFTAESYRVKAREQIQVDDYEPSEVVVEVVGSIENVENFDAERRYIRRQLLAHLRDLQKVAQQASENRLAIKDAEDWSDPLG